jgi:hypothetical protein
LEVDLRRIAVAVAVATAVAALTACSTDEVGSRAADVRSSAAAAADAAGNIHSREACVAVHDELATLSSLASRLANDPSLRVQLAPQVTAVVTRLTDKLSAATAGWREEWREVLQATGDLGKAMREANATSLRVTASQVVVVVKLAQAGCAIATR